MPETSIIIRMFNEERHLPALFRALAVQAYRDFEMVVVDSGSFDRSREIAAAAGVHHLVSISSHDFTFGYSLNAGIAAASGEIIAICSAHTIPLGPDWLSSLIDPLKRHDDVAMTYGRQVGTRSSKFSELEDFERIFGPHPREDRKGRFAVNNANSALPKRLWEKRRFDESLPGLEDVGFAQYWLERNLRIVYVPEAALEHIHEEPWGQVRRRYYREAVAARRLSVRGRRHIHKELVRGIWDTARDVGRAFHPDGNAAAERLGIGGRLKEIALFRANKTVGIVRGLLEAHPMESPEDRERALFNRSGRAVVVKGPGKAALEPVEIPTLKPGDALVRVAHVAVCATDHEIVAGTLGYYKSGLARYPIVPGHEFSGRVAAVGTKANGINVGDAVVAECIQSCGTCGECRAGNFIGCPDRAELGVLNRDGAYADYVVVPTRFLHKLPAGVDLRSATLVEPLAVVIKGLRRLGPALDGGPKRCMVLGAGPLGHLCARVLHHRGHQVAAYDRNPKRRALFEGTGIAAAVDMKTVPEQQVIIEITGHADVLDHALHASPANSALLLLGFPYGKKAFSFETVTAYDKTVIGSVGSTAEDFEAAIALLPALDLDVYFQCPVPLERFEEAWQKSRTGEVLKVIMHPGETDPQP